MVVRNTLLFVISARRLNETNQRKGREGVWTLTDTIQNPQQVRQRYGRQQEGLAEIQVTLIFIHQLREYDVNIFFIQIYEYIFYWLLCDVIQLCPGECSLTLGGQLLGYLTIFGKLKIKCGTSTCTCVWWDYFYRKIVVHSNDRPCLLFPGQIMMWVLVLYFGSPALRIQS